MPNEAPLPASIRGLSEADAQTRLKAEGYNELPRPDRRTPLRIVLEVLREPMLALLLGGGAIYLALGDLKEAIILLVFATMSVLITVVQETRTERVLEALRDLTSPRALVIRDGVRKRITGREVVRGDVLVLAEGDRVPADAVIIECRDLQTDESLLTGESVPVRKTAGVNADHSESHRPGGDDLPYVFSGSLVVRGTGMGEVVATGIRTEIGKIGHSLSTLETEPPRLQAQTRRLVRVFAMAGGTVSVLVVLLYGTLRGGWLDAVLAGIALGMSMLPEEFPVVLAVFMAMGRVANLFSLVLAIVSLIFVNRSFSASLITALRRPSAALGWVLLAVPVMLSLTLLFPPVSALFRFGPPHLDDLALTLGAGVLVLVFLEALKSKWRGRLSFSSQNRGTRFGSRPI